jgi:RimK family alpha-L-glutamate ligase
LIKPYEFSLLSESEEMADIATQKGLAVDLFSPQDVILSVDRERLSFFLRGRKYTDKHLPFSVVIPRIGSSVYTETSVTILGWLQKMGVPCFNNVKPFVNAEDKFTTHTLLAGKVRQPETYLVSASLPHTIIQNLPGSKVVLKTVRGSKGNGVHLVDKNEIGNIMEDGMLVQEFIDQEPGVDYRYTVIRGKDSTLNVVQALMRVNKDDFRANVALGGKPYEIPPEPDFTKAAITATQALGLDYSGVDLVRSPEGACVVEINPSPDYILLSNPDFTVPVSELIIDAALEIAIPVAHVSANPNA